MQGFLLIRYKFRLSQSFCGGGRKKKASSSASNSAGKRRRKRRRRRRWLRRARELEEEEEEEEEIGDGGGGEKALDLWKISKRGKNTNEFRSPKKTKNSLYYPEFGKIASHQFRPVAPFPFPFPFVVVQHVFPIGLSQIPILRPNEHHHRISPLPGFNSNKKGTAREAHSNGISPFPFISPGKTALGMVFSSLFLSLRF